MKVKTKICAIYCLIFSLFYGFTDEVEDEGATFTLYEAISLAVQRNYDIRKQQQALVIAQAKYLQAKGALDITTGIEGQYTHSQNPVDSRDPNYLYGYSFTSPDSVYGIFSKNSLTRQTTASLFMEKLFSIGLKSKLAYTLQRNNNSTDYDYGSTFSSNTYSKYKDEHGRNIGEFSLELSLPLFKSFNSSITALQIAQAKDYLEQMRFQLNDTISKAIMNTTKAFWSYYMAYKNLYQLKALHTKLIERNSNIGSMVRAGILMKNDILTMRVGVIANQKNVDSAEVEYLRAKMELANVMGISDVDFIENPSDRLPSIKLDDIENLPTVADITPELLNHIEENRIDFMILNDQIRSAEKDVRIARINGRPDASLRFKIGVNGTTYSDKFSDFLGAGFWNVKGTNLNGSFAVSIKPYDRDTKGKVMEAEANLETLLLDDEKSRGGLYLNLRNAIEKLTLYRNSFLKAEESFGFQKQLYDNEQERFKAGLIKVDNIIDQDQKYIQALQDRYQTLVNYLEALLEYKYATATLVYVDADSLFTEDRKPNSLPEEENSDIELEETNQSDGKE